MESISMTSFQEQRRIELLNGSPAATGSPTNGIGSRRNTAHLNLVGRTEPSPDGPYTTKASWDK